MLDPRRRVTGNILRGGIAALAILLVFFCSSWVVPSVAGDHGCRGSDSSARICGQSGAAADSLLTVIQPTSIPLRAEREASTLSAVPPTRLSVSQFHSDPSAPRAPPFLLV
jgi:hypothetical protein